MNPASSKVSEGNRGGWGERYRFEQGRRTEQEKVRQWAPPALAHLAGHPRSLGLIHGNCSRENTGRAHQHPCCSTVPAPLGVLGASAGGSSAHGEMVIACVAVTSPWRCLYKASVWISMRTSNSLLLSQLTRGVASWRSKASLLEVIALCTNECKQNLYTIFKYYFEWAFKVGLLCKKPFLDIVLSKAILFLWKVSNLVNQHYLPPLEEIL